MPNIKINAADGGAFDSRRIAAERRGRKSITYVNQSARSGQNSYDSEYPPDFGSWLMPFDLREVIWV